MIRRTLITVGLAAAAVALPAAAQATEYPAPEAGVECTPLQITPGGTIDCTVTGEGTNAQLQTTTSGDDATIAGVVVSGNKALVDGAASFTVTAPAQEGEIGIVGLVDGQTVGSATVEVAEELSGTGFDSAPLAVGAVVLLVGGALLIVAAGKTHAAQVDSALATLENVGAPISGLVLTMLPTKGPDAYGYGRYGYKYSEKD